VFHALSSQTLKVLLRCQQGACRAAQRAGNQAFIQQARVTNVAWRCWHPTTPDN
jgi:hypothetical protein